MQAQKVELSEIIAEASELGSAHWRSLLAAASVIVVGYGLLDWLTFEMEDAIGLIGIDGLALLTATNVLTSAASVLGWLIAVAAYRRAVPAKTQFNSVFG